MLKLSLLEIPHEVYGTEYGKWPIIGSRVGPGKVVYSFGCGTDISWDLALIEHLGATVHAFDPTPVSLEYIEKYHREQPGFIFSPIGLSDRIESLKLAAPIVNGGSSFFRGKESSQETIISVPCQDLSTIMSSFGHDRIDIIKMDIEGSEYAVVDDMIGKKIFPEQVLIEFHHDMYGYSRIDTQKSIDALEGSGYRPFYWASTGREIAFVRVDLF